MTKTKSRILVRQCFPTYLTCYPKLHTDFGLLVTPTTPLPRNHARTTFSKKYPINSVAHPVKREQFYGKL